MGDERARQDTGDLARELRGDFKVFGAQIDALKELCSQRFDSIDRRLDDQGEALRDVRGLAEAVRADGLALRAEVQTELREMDQMVVARVAEVEERVRKLEQRPPPPVRLSGRQTGAAAAIASAMIALASAASSFATRMLADPPHAVGHHQQETKP